jgi:hypothetical protein
MMLMAVQTVSTSYFERKLMSPGISFSLWIAVANEWRRLTHYHSEVHQEMPRHGQTSERKGKWQHGPNEGREQSAKMAIFGEA